MALSLSEEYRKAYIEWCTGIKAAIRNIIFDYDYSEEEARELAAKISEEALPSEEEAIRQAQKTGRSVQDILDEIGYQVVPHHEDVESVEEQTPVLKRWIHRVEEEPKV